MRQTILSHSPNRYNIYKKTSEVVNATYNWFGTINESQIESKFNIVDNLIYKPFLKKGYSIDLSIFKDDISFFRDNESNDVRIILRLNNLNSAMISNVEIELLDVFDYKIVKKKIINVSVVYSNILVVEDFWDFEEEHELHVIVDPNNRLVEVDKINNYASKVFANKKLIFLDVDIFPDVAKIEIENYLKDMIESDYIVDDIDNSEIIIKVRSNNDIIQNNEEVNLEFNNSFGGGFGIDEDFLTKNYLTQALNYEGQIISFNKNGKHIIEITGEDLEGSISGIKYFISNFDKFINGYDSFIIDKYNEDAISVYDFLHAATNEFYFKKESLFFKDIVSEVFYDEKFSIREFNFKIDVKNESSDYKMYRLLPKNSLNYREYIDKDHLPIVMAGGLWSDITTWQELGQELANEGYEVYLIEITGGDNIECDYCYNYDYDFLTDVVYPTYINKVLEISNEDKIKYVGHSNGARVALDSLRKGEVNPNIIDTLVVAGVPGAFEGETPLTIAMNTFGNYTNKNIKDNLRTHISLSDLLLLGLSSSSDNEKIKISVNLWNQYYNWITNTDDSQPGNINVNNFMLIAGNYSGWNNDGVVSIIDEKNIYNNVYFSSSDTSNFNYIELDLLHNGMAINSLIKNHIKNYINEKK